MLGTWRGSQRSQSGSTNLIAVSSGNAELAEVLRAIRSRVNWMFELDLEERAPGSWVDHSAIVDAIAAGNVQVVDRLIRRHVSEDRAAYDRLVSAQGGMDLSVGPNP